MQHPDVFIANATARTHSFQPPSAHYRGHFGGHARRYRAGKQAFDHARPIAGFLDQFAHGRLLRRFSLRAVRITNKTRRQLQHAHAHWRAILFHHQQRIIRGDRHNMHRTGRIHARDVLPFSPALQPQEITLAKGFNNFGHA